MTGRSRWRATAVLLRPAGADSDRGHTYSHDLMAADALHWVRSHQDDRFFLYLAFTIPHLSLQVPDDSLTEYRGRWPETPFTNTKHYSNQDNPRAAYAGMITRMDRDIGRLMALLKSSASTTTRWCYSAAIMAGLPAKRHRPRILQ